MSRDARMQRGLAVARRMNEAARHEKGMGELAWLGSRLGPADIRAIQIADARGGLPAVQQLLASAGLTDAGLAALEAQYGRGGLQAVGAAVQAQIAHEAQASAEQDAVAALEKLQPAQWNAAAQILASGGPEALARQAVALGLSREAAAVVARHLAQNGVEATRAAVAENVKATARADALHTLAERDLAAAKPGDPFGRVDVAQAALNYYTQHEASLARAGLGAKPNEPPVAWLRRVARVEGAAEKLAAATGGDTATAKTIVKAAAQHERTRESHELAEKVTARLSERDGTRPKAETKAPPRNDLREAIEAAASEHGLGTQRLAVGSALGGIVALAAGHDARDVETTAHADRDLTRMAARLEEPSPGPETSVRAALEHALAAEERDEDETTQNGGSNG